MFKFSVKLSWMFASTLLIAACGGPLEEDSTDSSIPAVVTNQGQELKTGDVLGEEWSGNVQMVYISCDNADRTVKEVRYRWTWPEGGTLTKTLLSDPGCP